MKSMHIMKGARGFSLVELMVALTIGLVLSGAMLSTFFITTKGFQAQDAGSRLQENARFALDILQRDIRMAGYRGCTGGMNNTPYTTKFTNMFASPGYQDNFAVSVQAYEASATSWTPVLDTSISGATVQPVAGTDVITIRMGTGAGTMLTGVMANGTVDIPVASTSEFSAGMTAVISNCVYATVFQVTGIAGGALVHAQAAGGNSAAALNRAYGTDALVFPVTTVTYYVAPSASAPSGTERSLWRLVNGTVTELVEGVDDMQLLYGEDTNGDLSPERYVTANAVANPSNIVAVKLNLLMKTQEDAITAAVQRYTYNGVANVTPTDRRLRRPYTLTIALRNRTN